MYKPDTNQKTSANTAPTIPINNQNTIANIAPTIPPIYLSIHY